MDVTRTFWDWVVAIVSKYGQMFISGAGTTMLIAITGTVIGFIIGLIVAIIKTVPVRPQDNKVKKIFLKIVNIILNIYEIKNSILCRQEESAFLRAKKGFLFVLFFPRKRIRTV